MPLYLVRQHSSSGPTTITLPVVVQDFEVEAINLLEAARRIITETGQGTRPDGIGHRRRNEAYSGRFIEPDLSRYDGVCDISDQPNSRLPRAVSIKALEGAIEAYAAASGTETENDLEIGAYHLVHGLADHFSTTDLDFAHVLRSAIEDAGPRSLAHLAKRTMTEFLTDGASSRFAGAGEAAIVRYAVLTGRENDTDRSDLAKDMIHALAGLASREKFDLKALLEQVASDRHDQSEEAIAAFPPTRR